MEAPAPIRKTLLETENLSWLTRLLATGRCSGRCQVARQAYERLERAITIKALIAWRLFAMVMMGCETPELPPDVLFSDLEIHIMEHVAQDRKRPRPDSLGSAMMIMAMLGGYVNRKQDGPPGYRIIRTGYAALDNYCQAHELTERLHPGIARGLTPEQSYPSLRPDRTCG